MKTLENLVINFKSQPLLDETTNSAFTTENIIRVVLENSSYSDSSQIIKAAKIVSNLSVEDGKITLDQKDFDFIKEMSSKYAPITTKGLMFLEYFKQLE